ncbi:hypothetical protein YQE_11339, partial [Dendroctonus ponderosae]
MGVVADRNRAPYELPGWIKVIKVKKNKLQKQGRKDLFVHAVLTHALSCAKRELQRKQEERRLKWQHCLSENVNSEVPVEPKQNFDSEIYREVNAELDRFMHDLNECTRTRKD